eukprot:CAMPEP_0202689824 /NCGR_PEP_ID=MMETSP1385-20130828/5013_1 /ASSEMBLY_ACC=CAM_ASM_000861 /TAXON_ID=933848 /ORGANISM="Elphidium margaritaceum" /LENGTH=43 /DNA_ID= /DNA_START= /DNA_END= /DNA_ORIENTATION=
MKPGNFQYLMHAAYRPSSFAIVPLHTRRLHGVLLSHPQRHLSS